MLHIGSCLQVFVVWAAKETLCAGKFTKGSAKSVQNTEKLRKNSKNIAPLLWTVR